MTGQKMRNSWAAQIIALALAAGPANSAVLVLELGAVFFTQHSSVGKGARARE